ncbi:hypothetical protein SDD30_03585 [Moorella naiadis]|uniref:hypothetical protein n=1 Tax=Moorella naiadis (nom. illeg.) TaxID=3093670 RepID=UPI003D9C974D
MRQKIGTAINPRLLYRARLFANQKQKHLNEIIEEALEQYLAQSKKKTGEGLLSVVRSTKGSLPVPADLVKKVLEEEAFFEI